MIVLLLILIGVLSVVSFVLTGAVVEMYRQLHRLTARAPGDPESSAGQVPESEETPLDRQPPSALGLPVTLDEADEALVVFVSDSCGTCADIAAGLRDRLPAGLWVVVVPVFGDAEEFAAGFPDHDGRVLIDYDRQVFDKLGLFGVPGAVRVSAGELISAHTVGSFRQLYQLLPVASSEEGES